MSDMRGKAATIVRLIGSISGEGLEWTVIASVTKLNFPTLSCSLCEHGGLGRLPFRNQSWCVASVYSP